MKPDLTARDLSRLAGVDRILCEIVRRAREHAGFHVIEGVRSAARQAELVAAKKSWSFNGRHVDGFAVDLMAWDINGQGTWDAHAYHAVNRAMRAAARDLGVLERLVWGGDWKVRDYVHWELRSPRASVAPAALAAVVQPLLDEVA